MEMGPMPEVMDYDLRYQEAQVEIGQAITAIRRKYRLTQSQFVSILAGQIQQTLTFGMRDERKRSR